MASDDSGFIDDIVSDQRPVHTEPLSNEFKPWHRVRKEFIRQQQWNELTRRLVKRRWQKELRQDQPDFGAEGDSAEGESVEIPTSEARKQPLKCLVIPGDDLLDVRALLRDTNDENCHVRYLGFNEGQGSHQTGTRVHVANNAVTSSPRVSTDSQVIADRFEMIRKPDSQACRYLRDYGPYHLVNLDFCGSIFPNTQSDTQACLDALHALLAYQFAEQRSRWLLFVTTEVQPSIADLQKLEPFCLLARQNFDAHSEFRDRVSAFLPPSAFRDSKVKVRVSDLSEEQVVKLFGVALGKWLLKLSHSAQPQWTIEMRRSFQYPINQQKGAVMLALAFEFSPNITPPIDHSGISSVEGVAKPFPDESACASRIAKEVAAMEDVDARLDADLVLKEKLAADHADLLELAGYDRAAYFAWVDAGESVG